MNIPFIDFFRSMSKKSKSVEDYYEDISEDVVPALRAKNTTKWLNIGYWDGVDNYNSACEQLAEVLARQGNFSSEDRVLDVGCGFGTQDFYWESLYSGIDIKAIDLTRSHIEWAIKKQKELPQSKVAFRQGSACDLTEETGNYTKVVALDCVYHFETRETFFHEAHQVLAEGGTLALTDMVPGEKTLKNCFFQRKGREKLFIPEANICSPAAYISKLEAAGFSQIKVTDISKEVFAGLAVYFVKRFLHPKREITDIRLKTKAGPFMNLIGPKIWGFFFGTPRYIIITAQKETA